MPIADKSGHARQPKIFTNIKILLTARLAIISFFMGTVAFYQAKYGKMGAPFPAMAPVGAAYLLTIAYAIFLKFVTNPLRFVNVQLTFDLVLVSWIVFCTGGLNSPFSFKYILIIIASAFFRGVSSTYVLATASSILYCGLVTLEYLGIIEPYYVFPPLSYSKNFFYVFMTALMNVTTFYFVAVMSVYLTRVIKKTDQQLIKKNEDFTALKAFHENVLKSMGLGFLAIDMDGSILSHNQAAERILRLDSSQIERQPVDKVLQAPQIKSFFSGLDREIDPARQFDSTFKSKDNTEICLSINISKFTASGQTQGIVAVFNDVTAIKKMESQMAHSERLAAIGRVAAGIAHEIRNPLASLSGSIQMLNSDLGYILTEQNAKLMDITMREADRLNRIITRFLNYTSMQELDQSVTDTGNLLTETATLLQSNPQYQSIICFDLQIEPDLEACIDQEQIRQVIWNLCVNAIEAMPDGGTLTVRSRKESPRRDKGDRPAGDPKYTNADEYVHITITDTGVGIDNASLEKIFEPFYTTKAGGTGLGLPMVHKIIDIHHGKVEATSSPGHGSTFSVWLPLYNRQTGEMAAHGVNESRADS